MRQMIITVAQMYVWIMQNINCRVVHMAWQNRAMYICAIVQLGGFMCVYQYLRKHYLFLEPSDDSCWDDNA